ncbi:PulJ/GspJ family protein [Fontivita pretiosa]|uniref:PulJ/GspJ family protein n=1 Tax=Fontivita pretiosa TaxID=2989684 RepID=UPI003D1807E4
MKQQRLGFGESGDRPRSVGCAATSSFILRAFTLVELMISIALMLLLMAGVNLIFRMTGQAVGAGQTLSEITRNAQAAQAVMQRDFSAAVVKDAPAIILVSRTQPAFRNRADQESDRNYDPSGMLASPTDLNQRLRVMKQVLDVDLDSNNLDGESTVPGEVISSATYNHRNHRIDILSFFVSDLIRRQTGNDGSLIADQASSEGWIWYGHLWLPDASFQYPAPLSLTIPSQTFPGQGTADTNPHNFYATQWILGRAAIALVEPDRSTNPPVILDRNNIPQDYLSFDETNPGWNPSMSRVQQRLPLAPLQTWTLPTDLQGTGGTAPANAQLQMSRYDLAGTSIATMKSQLEDFANTYGWNRAWWTLLMSSNALPNPLNQGLLTGGRFQTVPYLVKPVSAASYAKLAPIFLPGCTQFIVEYAGDFVRQNRNSWDYQDSGVDEEAGVFGDVLDACIDPSDPSAYNDAGTDGEIDFIVDFLDSNNNGIPDTPNELATARKRIRWYGFPRDVAGSPTGGPDGHIDGNDGTSPIRASHLRDVVPLRDVIQTLAPYKGGNNRVAPFERFYGVQWTADPSRGIPPRVPFNQLPRLRDYAATTPPNVVTPLHDYTCAWGPRDRIKPSMIRITIVLDDPNGRLGEGQTFEYVFKLQ